jgi:putative spermidine/putrescine transport system ATP-binding protein
MHAGSRIVDAGSRVLRLPAIKTLFMIGGGMVDLNDPLVRFVNVQKSYDGETLVVKNLNLDIARGEFLTMLGPSGSGKTTCLLMLAGFEPATHGEITLNGVSINNVAPHKRGIGMVFQNYALFPHMTVAENLAFPLQVRRMGRSEVESKVKRALGMVQLDAFGSRRPGQLSGGQQQRVAVARALVFEPDLVLMDEPLGALDKQLREQMQYEIKHIHENVGVTITYVTHDQSEALTMSNRIAVFNEGIIQQLAMPDELYEKPLNTFVARFIGENNTLQGVVREVENDGCMVEVNGGEMVRALAVNIEGVGTRTTLSLRPERVAINPAPGSCPNVFEGRVEELIYLGDHIRTRANVCGHDDFIVKIPNSSDHASLVEGDAVKVGWTMEDCRALDA